MYRSRVLLVLQGYDGTSCLWGALSFTSDREKKCTPRPRTDHDRFQLHDLLFVDPSGTAADRFLIWMIWMIWMVQLMLPGGSGVICTIYYQIFPGLDPYCTDPTPNLTTAGSLGSRRTRSWSICPMICEKMYATIGGVGGSFFFRLRSSVLHTNVHEKKRERKCIPWWPRRYHKTQWLDYFFQLCNDWCWSGQKVVRYVLSSCYYDFICHLTM